ncbi:uncharacterized protein METZ01_LOCUS295733, partial [marine metagenome]
FEGCKRTTMYQSHYCYKHRGSKVSGPPPTKTRNVTGARLRKEAGYDSEPIFRCADEYSFCEYDFTEHGRCMWCGEFGPPDVLEFLTTKSARFNLLMDMSPELDETVDEIVWKVWEDLAERDMDVIDPGRAEGAPESRIERLSSSRDMLEPLREHLDDATYERLERGLREIEGRERPWADAVQADAAKGWWLPDDLSERTSNLGLHSDRCHCDGCLPQREKEEAKRDLVYTSMTMAQLKEILRDRDLPTSGRKAELIDRLMEDDFENSPLFLLGNIIGVIFATLIAIVFVAQYWPFILMALAYLAWMVISGRDTSVPGGAPAGDPGGGEDPFSKLDADGDGIMTREEFENAMNQGATLTGDT